VHFRSGPVAGALFGAAMASYWVYKARKLKLPAWSEIRTPSSVFE
jgi:hypothetical protein